MTDTWLRQVEETVAASELAVAIVTVAAVAGRELEAALAEPELRGAARRALFVLASGGDPDRGLDLNGPAVTRFADDIATDDRRAALQAGLSALREDALGFPHVTEIAQGLLDAPDTAWRAFACALLAEELDED